MCVCVCVCIYLFIYLRENICETHTWYSAHDIHQVVWVIFFELNGVCVLMKPKRVHKPIDDTKDSREIICIMCIHGSNTITIVRQWVARVKQMNCITDKETDEKGK